MKKVILIVLGIVILAVGGYFIYNKFFKTSGGSSSVTSSKPDSNCKYNDPDLCKFINGWKNVKYYTLTSDDTFQGVNTKSVLKFANNNIQITMSENGKENYNTITIDNTTYTKDYTDNQWWKMTSTPSPTASAQAQEELNFAETDQTTYQKIGTEACDKLTCFKYQEIDPNVTDSTTYIYFDNKDYLLRKMTTTTTDGSTSNATIDYSKVSVSAPSPVKSGSPSQGTIPAE